MNTEDIQKSILYHSEKIAYCINNYDTLYSKQYKLEKNRIKRANARLIRHMKMLELYINEFIDVAE